MVELSRVYSCSMPNHGSSAAAFSMATAQSWREFVGRGCADMTSQQASAPMEDSNMRIKPYPARRRQRWACVRVRSGTDECERL